MITACWRNHGQNRHLLTLITNSRNDSYMQHDNVGYVMWYMASRIQLSLGLRNKYKLIVIALPFIHPTMNRIKKRNSNS